jgi:flagellar M-ring protein FliF
MAGDEIDIDDEKIEVQEGESLEDIKAKLKPKKSAISAEMLDTANTYDDKVAVIRMIVGDEAGRVSSVFKGMMGNDARDS